MVELRREYHQRLRALEDELLGMGNIVLEMLDDAVAALATDDGRPAAAVIRRDDDLDERYVDVYMQLFDLLARESPVAADLRLVTAFMHANLHLERMGDLCVNVARAVQLAAPSERDPELLAQVQEMGAHARRVVSRSLDALARRDLDMVHELPALDRPIDALNRGLFARLVTLAATDESRLGWAMRMVLVARAIERLADHAVDVGEQVIFAVTGEVVELASNSPAPDTDA